MSLAVALILAFLATPLAIGVFSRRGRGQLIGEEGPAAHATKRGTPTMGGTAIVIASLIGYAVGHVLTREPMAVSGVRVLALMTGFGLAGFVYDFIKIHRQTSRGRRSRAKLALGLDGLGTGASVLGLGAYVLILSWQLSNCSALLTRSCYLVRDPLDLAVVAASVLGACFGFLWWNASLGRIFIGATGSLALGGVLAGLAITADAQLLLPLLSGLFVLITLSVMRKWAMK